MKIQGILDLSGFELQNFCIQNYTDKEKVANLARGRKFFFTGNSTDQDYHRELIYDGSSWRATAYLDDIDKITNGEGSLGTRVKALEDMLGLKDVTNVIDTWNDVQEFFKNVDEGINLMTMLDGKLDSNNGTASILTVKQRLIMESYICFNQYNEEKEYLLGMTSAGIGSLQWYNGTAWNTLLHSGNVGDYALKTDGSNRMTAPIKFSEGSVDYDAVGDGLAVLYTSSANNAPNNDAYGRTLSVVNGSAGFQLGIAPAYPTLYYRAKNSNSWSDWKTIAFTDSTVEAAYKLVKSSGTEIVTIDDNGTTNFAGEIDAAYNIIINPPSGIAWRVAEEKILNVATGSTGNFVLGGGGAAKGYNTYLDGGTLYFRTAKEGVVTTAMTITDGGNVEVAGANNAYTRKLAVGIGSAHIVATVTGLPSLDTLETNSLLVGSVHYGLQIGTDTNDEASFIQAQRFNSADAKTLNLNPLGGAVNVGEGGLNVAGNAVLEKIVSFTTGETYYNRAGANYLWAPKEGGHFVIGVGANAGDAYASLSIYDYAVRPGSRNNAVSLGTSSYRWSNVYSTLGDFSGLATFNGGALIPTGQKLTIGDATIEYDSNAKAIKVDGNMYTTGTNASGGKADAQQGGTGGNAEVHEYEFLAGQSTYTELNPKGSRNVIVQIYEWNSNGNTWDMILTDVSVTDENIIVTFGRDTTVKHLMTVV